MPAAVCHLTAHHCAVLASGSGTPACSLALTNCLLVGVTNSGSITIVSNWVSVGDESSLTNIGAGYRYLAAGSGCRGTGTTNLPAGLLADLARMTTFPPVTYNDVTLSNDLLLTPQVARDTLGSDRGYHYPVLDYDFGGVTMNANIRVLPGTVVGWHRTTSGWYHAGHGVHLADQKTASFEGAADAPCWWVRRNLVQEGEPNAFTYGPGGITGWADELTNAPVIQARFTRFSMLAYDGGCPFRDDWGFLIARVRDSEFWTGPVGGYWRASYFTNCLFDRSQVHLVTGATNVDLVMRNCTMHGGWLTVNRNNVGFGHVCVRDCLFDGTTINPTNDYYSYNSTLTSYSNNAYSDATNVLSPFTTSNWVTNMAWEAGPLGNFYMPSNSPFVNSGGDYPTNLGLFHFTTQTNQTKELASILDRGYHYIALGGNNLPVDSDGDSLEDWREDSNGNGITDAGETAWETYNPRYTNMLFDVDGNHVWDIFEDVSLPTNAPFMSTPFIVTGCIEAEQFDKGGNDKGYHCGVDHANTTYRASRVAIEPCDDRGLGYCVTKLKKDDWLKYTFQVLRSGYYTVEVRALADGVGGTFKLELTTTNAAGQWTNQNTSSLTPTNSWQSLAAPGIWLSAGTNYCRLIMAAEGASGFIGRFNHISIYPTVTPEVISSNAVTVTGLTNGTSFLNGQANSWAIQLCVSNALSRGGGKITIPPGTYYLAQSPLTGDMNANYWEHTNSLPSHTYAVDVRGTNLTITGTLTNGTNATVLQAHNRAVALFWGQNPSETPGSNITFQNLILQGAPHTRPNGSTEFGWFTPEEFHTASLIVLGGAYQGQVMRGITIQNCVFKNARYSLGVGEADGILIRSNCFLYYADGSPNGDPTAVPTLDAILQDDPRDPTFVTNDFVNLWSLMNSHIYGINGNPTDDWVWRELSSVTISNRVNYVADPTNAFKASLLRTNLMDEFNRIIRCGSNVYASDRFTNLYFPETRIVLNSNPTGTNLVRLNRMLLEDAYHQVIASTAGVSLSAGDGNSGRHAAAHTCVAIAAKYTTNIVVIENGFNGCVTNLTCANDMTNFYGTDGLLICQNGVGNSFAARNDMTNYWLEAIAITDGGPAAVVGNRYTNAPYNASTCALLVMNNVLWFPSNKLVFPELTFSFVGNTVYGGRSGVLSYYSGFGSADPPQNMHVCGNDVWVSSPGEAAACEVWDYPNGGGLAMLANCGGLNMAGNTFCGLGSPCQGYWNRGVAEIINNDFRGASYTEPNIFHSIMRSSSDTQAVLIAQNQLGLNQGSSGSGAHLFFDQGSCTNYFLLKNSYWDWTQTVPVAPVVLGNGSAIYIAPEVSTATPWILPSGCGVYIQY